MKKNMGLIDRVIRILVAIIFIALFFANVVTGIAGVILLVLAGVFILTSLLSICPLYLPFGISTAKKE
jgi:hypothetical protein